MKVRKQLILGVAFLFFLGFSVEANGQKWKIISSTIGTPKARFHTAFVAKKNRDVRELKLRAFNATVKFWTMTVYFNDGERQVIELNTGLLLKNVDSRTVELDNSSGVKKITFFMNTVSFKGKKAGIWIYGR